MASPRINDHSITGNLNKDPEVRTRPNGSQMVVLSVADNQRRFDQNSKQWVDAGAVHYDVAIGDEDMGRNVLSSLRKGNRVAVTGTYTVEAFADAQGNSGINHKIWAEDVSASMKWNQLKIGPSVSSLEKSMNREATANQEATVNAAPAPSDTDFDPSFS